jgi:8-oxo-dGTP diphosphatase
MIRWVVGFLIRNRSEVALMTKTHPEWQKGKLNGVGGKIDDGESPEGAMRREFLEEAGVDVPTWRKFAPQSASG